MNGSKNNIANRHVSAVEKCATCGAKIKPVRVIRRGKARMIKSCDCS